MLQPGNVQLFVQSFNNMAHEVHQNMKGQGFWDKERNDAEAIMLTVCELAEGVEYLRHGNGPSDHIPEFSGIEEEFADAIIRMMDIAKARGWRIPEAVVAKIVFNTTREKMHGKKF